MSEPNDRELDALLRRRSELAADYRRAFIDEPSPQIDAYIRAAARRAVHSGPGKQVGRERWVIPAAAAAVLVLGVSVAVQVRDNEPTSGQWGEAAKNQGEKREPQVATGVPQKQVEIRRPDAASPKLTRVEVNARGRDDSSEMDANQSHQRKDLPNSKAAANGAESNRSKALVPVPTSKPSGIAEPTLRGTTVVAPVRPETFSTQAGSISDAAKKSELLLQESDAVAPASESRSNQAGQISGEQADVGPQEPSRPAEAAKGLEKLAAPVSETGAPAERSPEDWLKEIASLRRQGRLLDAERNLQDFRRRYPSYPIPPSIPP